MYKYLIINLVIASSISTNKGFSFPRGYSTVIVASTKTCFLIRSINSGRQDIYFAFFNFQLPGDFFLLSTCHYSSVQSLSRVQLFVTPWIAARQASLSITNSWSLLKLMSIKSVMPSSHLILCRPLLLLPPSLPASGSFPMTQLFA